MHSEASGREKGFNPRSPPKRRATCSAYAPPAASGFQSTLPSEKESDTASALRMCLAFGFQSTLPSEKESDLPAELSKLLRV